MPEWIKDVPYELFMVFENVVADGVYDSMNDIPKKFALDEAKELLSTFMESGHSNNEWLNSDDEEDRQKALKQMNEIREYIRTNSKRNRKEKTILLFVNCSECGNKAGSTYYEGIKEKWISKKYTSKCCKAPVVDGGFEDTSKSE